MNGAFDGKRFAFAFGESADEPLPAAPLDVSKQAAAAPEPAIPYVMVVDDGCELISEHVADPVLIPRGTVLRVDWAGSSFAQLKVAFEGAEGFIEPRSVTLAEFSGVASSIGEHLWRFDPVFDPNHAGLSQNRLHFAINPLVIEPSLQAFVWPLHASTFRREVYGLQRALVVQGTGGRLSAIKDDFHNFQIEQMLADASKIVVWMKTTAPTEGERRMQYIDVPDPNIALTCYRSGHSLYFNPSIEIQRKYIEPICHDLGMDFAASMDGGFGGDLEVFAVNGTHTTPWHFDSQMNLTVQLRGVKRWWLKKGALHDPMTNRHPSSTNVDSVLIDSVVHACTGMGMAAMTPPDGLNDQGVEVFTLRPGSTMFFPGGMWHRVESLDPEVGSLSINLSIDGGRWVDVFMSRVMPLLWSDERWRHRVQCASPEQARDTLQSLLDDLPQKLATVSARDYLPNGIFLEHRSNDVADVIELTSDDGNEHIGLNVSRNPLVAFVAGAPDKPLNYSIHVGASGRSGVFASDFRVTLRLPDSLKNAADKLTNLSSDRLLAVAELVALAPDTAVVPLLHCLLRHLIHNGYLRVDHSLRT